MVYANVSDVTSRMTRELSDEETALCGKLLEDAAVLIDSYNSHAELAAKRLVSCRMVIRALGDGESSAAPLGAVEGTMSALGYSQGWKFAGGGAAGELYIGKTERQILGLENAIGARSALESMVWPLPAPPEGCCHD